MKYNGKSLIGGGRTVTINMVSEPRPDYSARRRSQAKNNGKTSICKQKDKKKGKRSAKISTTNKRVSQRGDTDHSQQGFEDSADDLFCKENAEDAKLWTQPPKISKMV